jgi:hypothetical protein
MASVSEMLPSSAAEPPKMLSWPTIATSTVPPPAKLTTSEMTRYGEENLRQPIAGAHQHRLLNKRDRRPLVACRRWNKHAPAFAQ